MSTESDPATKRSLLADHIRKQVRAGNIYFKSSNLAEELGMSPKEVGSNLVFLKQEIDDLEIEKWARASKATTWRIEPSE